MTTLKAVRGTRDLLPPETALWNRIEATARAVFTRYNFGEIRTPVFEDTALFARSVGEETDIVSKEMYTWEDRARAQSEKPQSLTLRPENTAGVVRAYIEHKLGETGQLQKLYYIGPQFRRERPQKGRYRQFSQIGAEVIGPPSAGSESPLRDAEVLEMLSTLLDELGIQGWTLEINSVGSSADRARYNDVLREALVPVNRGQEDDRQLLRHLRRSEPPRDLEAVHLRHLHVEEDHRERLGRHALERLLARRRLDHAHAERLEDRAERDQVRRRVVDDQHVGRRVGRQGHASADTDDSTRGRLLIHAQRIARSFSGSTGLVT